MEIKVNGEKKIVAGGTTLQALLDGLSIVPQGIAVEVNREIVPKRLWGVAALNEGDSVEIVRMVGGG